ncbi:unnamed protein product [Adineta steineri]|uniref:Uncharacterized protein n=1 Tax=Adineta steineri TaxID=433720 RepID=A0A815KE48_9BILA|nr:unnamed protein product [Adineta steineri]CAF3722487.1 unnamed protein product [Adineta steineri]
MTSVTLPRRVHNLHLIREHRNHHSYTTDDDESNNIIDKNSPYFSNRSKLNRAKAFSYDEPEIQSSLPTSPTITNNNNRLKHLCSRLKRRFVLTKEDRTRSEDIHENTTERRMVRFGNYESFSSTIDDQYNEFVWPDFERVYDTIPPCLINALPGLDDYSDDGRSNNLLDLSNFQTDQTALISIEQMNLFTQCKRGKYFRRNAICHKLDKSQYNAQLDTFIQQIMVEKLMRTWT